MEIVGRRVLGITALLGSLQILGAAPSLAQVVCAPQLILAQQTYYCRTGSSLNVPGGVFNVQTGGTLDLIVQQPHAISSTQYDISSSGTTTIRNFGTIGSASGVYPVYFFNNSTFSVTNFGRIIGDQFAVYAYDTSSGTIINGTSGTIVANGTNGAVITANSTSTTGITITNYGTVSSTGPANAAVWLKSTNTSPVTINNYGTLSATGPGSAAIYVDSTTARLTVNIYPGSSILGGLNYSDPTARGSTINFYTGSYSLAVQGFLLPNHTVNLKNAGSVLNFAGTDTANGNGTLVVTTPAPTANMPVATQAVASAVQSALQMAVPRNVVAPLPNTLPDTSRTFAPDDAGGPANAPPMSLGMRDSYQETALPANRQGIDRYGNLVWARAFGSAHFQPNTDAVAGNINRTTGALVGYDRQFTNWRLGVYGGYGLSNTELSDSSGKLQTEMYIGGLYGRTKLGVTTLTFNLAGGLLGNHSSRIINGGRDASATADFSGGFVAPDIAIAYDMPLGNGFTLTPGLRARYIGTFTQDYAEGGSNQNITYEGARSHTAEERAELRLARTQRTTAGTLLATYLDGAVIARQRLDAGAITANVLGTEFSIQSGTAGTVTGLQLGAGVDLQIAKNVSVYTSGDVAEYTDGSKAASARLGLRMAF